MAIPTVEDPESSGEDIQALALAQSYFVLSESAAWKDLMERVELLVNAAKQEMFSSLESDPQKIVMEKSRWQQREFAQAAMLQIVQSQLETRMKILEEMKGEPNEYDTAE